jgi:DNA-binding CsgD family transcriptional regulator
VLLGFYSSSTHAIAWAARHPERVRGLIFFGGSIRHWDAMRGAGTLALLSLIERDWDTFVESATHAWLGWPAGEEGRLAADVFRTATSPVVAKATIQAAGEIDVTGEIGLVRCPALVLHRADAQVIPLDESEELARALPAGRLEIMPGSSATLFFEDPASVVDRIAAFVHDPHSGPDHGRKRARRTHGSSGLSPRELEVLRLLAGGETNGQIAVGLGISINTVERHVVNVYRKIDARGRADATAWAIRNGVA